MLVIGTCGAKTLANTEMKSFFCTEKASLRPHDVNTKLAKGRHQQGSLASSELLYLAEPLEQGIKSDGERSPSVVAANLFFCAGSFNNPSTPDSNPAADCATLHVRTMLFFLKQS